MRKKRKSCNVGIKHPLARLSEMDVKKIREYYRDFPKMTYVKLGRMFGVTPTQMYNIVKRKRWKHIE